MYDQQIKDYGFIPFDHQKPNFFPVAMKPVFDATGKAIPNYQRVERGDTGDTLAIHTDAYSMVPYERHFSLFEEAIKESRLPWRTMQIGTDQDKNGARIFRQYLFPDAEVAINAVTGPRPQLLRIFMFDSYDGSSAFIGRAGAFDTVCCNSMFTGISLLDFKFRHTGDMDAKVRIAADALTNAAEKFILNIQRMQHWTKIGVNAEEVEHLVLALPQSNKTLANQIVADWAKQPDDTLWGVNQVLTGWASHGCPVRTQADRQKRISLLVEGKDWHEYERRVAA